MRLKHYFRCPPHTSRVNIKAKTRKTITTKTITPRAGNTNFEYYPIMSAPNIKLQYDHNKRWDYDVFLHEVEQDSVTYVDMKQDQKEADVTFKDGTTKHIVLPSGYNHIGLLMNNNVEIHISEQSLFSPVDISLFAVQIALFLRLSLGADKNVGISGNTNLNSSQLRDDAKETQRVNMATRESGEIIADILTHDVDTTTMNYKDKLSNDVLISMSGLIAQDLFNGMLKNIADTNFDILHTLRLAVHFFISSDYYSSLPFPELLKCVYQSYRQARVLLRRNLKYIKRLRLAILSQEEPLNDSQINQLVSGINCEYKSKL